MSQLTLRNIPDDLKHSIRDYSQKKGQSINKTILDLLEKEFGSTANKHKQRNLSFISGTWTQEQFDEFEENVKIFEQIDENN